MITWKSQLCYSLGYHSYIIAFSGMSKPGVYSRKHNFDVPDCEFRYHKFFGFLIFTHMLEKSQVLAPLWYLCLRQDIYIFVVIGYTTICGVCNLREVYLSWTKLNFTVVRRAYSNLSNLTCALQCSIIVGGFFSANTIVGVMQNEGITIRVTIWESNFL